MQINHRLPKPRNDRGRTYPRGFSLVELLVVLAVIASLFALLLPSIQKVREAANHVLCANRLRQLGIASHHYHADMMRLPPGYFGPSLANNANRPAYYREGQWVGHLILLLPYLEQDATLQGLKLPLRAQVVDSYPWFRMPDGVTPNRSHYAIAFRKLSMFLCPSAAEYTPSGDGSATREGRSGTILGFHVYNSPFEGPVTVGKREDYRGIAEYQFLGVTNYVGVAGCAGEGNDPVLGKYRGVFTNRKEVALAQISNQDGTSNTLLYGESCGSKWTSSQPGSMAISWMGGGSLGTYLGLHRANRAEITAFSSYHVAGVPFCFADGSVRNVRYANTAWNGLIGNFTGDWLLLQELAGYCDGSNSSQSSLLE